MRHRLSNLTEPLREPPSPAWIDAPFGARIPVRFFGADGSGRPVVLLHGLQSHSGWFVQSARHIAALGLPVHAFDRCGSGVSGVECNGGPRLARLLEEVDVVAERALAESGHGSFYLLGHCFGAIPALLYAALYRPERVAGVVLATPALYTRTDALLPDKIRVLWSVLTRRPASVPVPLSPEQFSELEPFVEFVRDDPLIRKEFPARFLFEVRRARALLPDAARALSVPTLVAIAGDDTICDNPRSERLLRKASAPLELHVYPGARHILEFSDRRNEFLEDLTAWFAQREAA